MSDRLDDLHLADVDQFGKPIVATTAVRVRPDLTRGDYATIRSTAVDTKAKQHIGWYVSVMGWQPNPERAGRFLILVDSAVGMPKKPTSSFRTWVREEDLAKAKRPQLVDMR